MSPRYYSRLDSSRYQIRRCRTILSSLVHVICHHVICRRVNDSFRILNIREWLLLIFLCACASAPAYEHLRMSMSDATFHHLRASVRMSGHSSADAVRTACTCTYSKRGILVSRRGKRGPLVSARCTTNNTPTPPNQRRAGLGGKPSEEKLPCFHRADGQ